MRLGIRSGMDDGFSIFDVLIALLVATTVAVGVVDLFVVSLSSIRDAHEESVSTTLAVQKIEQLRGTSAGLTLSTDDALERDTAGFFDMIDAFGDPATLDAGTPRSTVYVRRWSVRPLPSDVTRGRVLRVSVSSVRREAHREPADVPRQRAHAEVLFATVKTAR